jgi:hypothetical protein
MNGYTLSVHTDDAWERLEGTVISLTSEGGRVELNHEMSSSANNRQREREAPSRQIRPH